MRWWVLRAAAVALMALSLVLMLGAGRDGFLSCAGAEYSPTGWAIAF